MQKGNLESSSFLVLFVGISLLLFFVFAPFFAVLTLATVSAVLLHAPYEKLTRLFGGWKSLAAIVTVGLMLVFVIVPLFFLGVQIFHEAQGLYASIYGNGPQYIHFIQNAIENPVQRLFPEFTFNVQAYLENILVAISNNLGLFAYQTLFITFETFLMLLTLFFFLRDGRGLLSSFTRISPLGKEMTSNILGNMYKTIGSVMKGTLLVVIIRWVCISIGFFLFGIPNAVLWGSIGGIVGAIPGLGTPFAFIPAVVYLYLQGNIFATVGLAAFGIATIILVDNILSPYFFGKGLAIAPIFVLFSILGGIVFFGPLGFIIGPLVLSVFLSVVRTSGLVERES
ncbi:MAG: AI-2E family transporter [Candidatus Kaiserbacteria bacterium]|nr:AI-2E family transporter [Candidatus Kaiserbacteria bacterium]